MKVVLLAGGLGSRLSEHTETRPKPMIEIGPYPILWHIMNIYASHGFNEFIVACGYKGEVIKDYFHSFFIRHSDYVVSLKDGAQEVVRSEAPDWKIALVDTGLHTMTGGRLRRLGGWLGDATFMVTYGDGVGNVDIRALVAFHRSHGKLATVTAVRPPARFGGLTLEGDKVREFSEKSQSGEGWINGGFFVFESAVLEYMKDDTMSLEREPLERLARGGQLAAYRHEGFWHPMDTLRDKRTLESLWESGKAPWKTW
jgi:glucose-1-phosphate cytidylyltransferase